MENSPTYPFPSYQRAQFVFYNTRQMMARDYSFDLVQPHPNAQVIVDLDLLGFVYHWGLDINSITVIGEFTAFLSSSEETYLDTR